VTPGTTKVIRILAATSIRRWWNRVGAFLRKRKDGRGGTGRKGGRSMVVLAFAGSIMFFQAFAISYQALFFLAAEFDRPAARAQEPEKPEADGEESVIEFGDRLEPDHSPLSRTFPHLGRRAWPQAEHERAFTGALALILVALVTALVFLALGTGNTELSQAGWSLEWLFGFPVAARSLLLAKVGEYALTSLFAWFTLFPFLSTVLWVAGWGPWGLLGGAAMTVCLAATISSIRLLVETAARKRLALHDVKNLQAVCTLVGMLVLFGVFALGRPGVLVPASRAAGRFLELAPAGCAAAIARAPMHALLFVAWTASIVVFCVWRAERIVATGLVSAGGPYQGARRPAKATRPIGGMLSKDVRLLARDRNLLVQTLIVPLVIIGFQFIANPSFSRAGAPRMVAVLAYGVGAYVVAFGGLRILITEQNALWLLYSFPQRLDRLLRRKAILWGCAAAAYTAAVLAYAWRPGSAMNATEWISPFLALGGVFLCSFLAGAMGTLGCDPFERELSKKIRSEWSLLYMAVAAALGYGIATADLWRLCGLVVLVLFLAFALWDRVRRRVPYFLDPTAEPPRRIEMVDGLVAVLAFMVLQLLFSAIAVAAEIPPAFVILVSFWTAGLVTVLLSLYVLWRARVRRLARDLGLRRLRAGAVLAGIGCGAVLGAAALGYVHLFRDGTMVRRAMEQMSEFDAASRLALGFVFVVLAPLFEEFLFRGLLFRGLERVIRPGLAVLASAMLFALMHPATSFPPVFLLGALCAFLLRRTGQLGAPIAAHMAYNGIVTLAPFL